MHSAKNARQTRRMPVQPRHRTTRSRRLAAMAILTGIISASAHAITIDQTEFIRRGGDPAALTATIEPVFESLRQASYAEPAFLAVGTFSSHLGNCTGTWLGDAPEDPYSYFLTAAHCVDRDRPDNVIAASINARFTDWQQHVVANGNGIFGVADGRTEERKQNAGETINPALPFGSHLANDMAIVTLPKIAAIVDANGQPLKPPTLDLGALAPGQAVTLIGHGAWGVDGLDASHYGPSSGPRRALGFSTIAAIAASDGGLRLDLERGSVQAWMRAAAGDDGAPIWRQRQGEWRIIGTACCAAADTTYGASLGTQLRWLKEYSPLIRVVDESGTPLTTIPPRLEGSPLMSPFH